MKFSQLLFIAIIIAFFSCQDKEKEPCNYITDYHQYIYQAEIAYLKEDYQNAYDLIKKAEKNCTLLNQTAIYEPRMMAEICIRLDKKEEVFPYLYMLLENGMPFSSVLNNMAFEPLFEMPEWENFATKAPEIETQFLSSINKDLRNEIIEMNYQDQLYRTGNSDYEKMQFVDSINENRIKEIFETYGYPSDKLIGPSTVDEHTDITAMLMHFKDTTYFKPILLDYIKKGDAPPRILPSMIDSRLRRAEQFWYGIYNNADSTKIKDFKNIDKRRVAVGLRPYQMEKEYFELIRKKYNIDDSYFN
tara:strand:- start:6159 stop:7067 length:909 start_codon:yes stop_codon:yes gene_type:complete